MLFRLLVLILFTSLFACSNKRKFDENKGQEKKNKSLIELKEDKSPPENPDVEVKEQETKELPEENINQNDSKEEPLSEEPAGENSEEVPENVTEDTSPSENNSETEVVVVSSDQDHNEIDECLLDASLNLGVKICYFQYTPTSEESVVIKNYSQQEVDLKDFQLKDANLFNRNLVGRKISSFILQPLEFVKIDDLGFKINNSNETIYLFDQNDMMLHKCEGVKGEHEFRMNCIPNSQ